MVFWTNATAGRSPALPRSRQLTGAEPHNMFGVCMLRQTYELDLTA
jgi:hypothetical protein